MKFDRNIQLLKDTLASLGFENGLENALRSHICYQPERFTLNARIQKDPDVMDFILYFEMHDSNGYACRYYDAILRKRSPLEGNIIADVNVPSLDKRMSLIDWNIPASSTSSGHDREESIDSVISDLKKLDNTEEGKKVAELLRLKYWPGTLAESLTGSGGIGRNKSELSQRFYFFDGRSQITVEEAYRYLCNRWVEKELNSRRKQTDSGTPDNTLPDEIEEKINKQAGKGGRRKNK